MTLRDLARPGDGGEWGEKEKRGRRTCRRRKRCFASGAAATSWPVHACGSAQIGWARLGEAGIRIISGRGEKEKEIPGP